MEAPSTGTSDHRGAPSRPFADAISAGWICDYEIQVPLIVDDQVADITLEARASFLADGIMCTGVRRIIVYCSSKAECDVFLGELREVMLDFHGLHPESVWMHRLTDEVSLPNRRRLLGHFQAAVTDGKVRVLACVRILDEAVDLPVCDAICILHPNEKKEGATRLIQRMMRAGRKDMANPNKIARVFLCINDYRVPECFDVLKDQDIDFAKKIKVHGDLYRDDVSVPNTLELQESSVKKFQENIRVVAVEYEELKWRNIRCYNAYYQKYKKPMSRDILVDGLRPGQWMRSVRRGRTMINDAQKRAILDVYPAALQSRREAQEEEKERLLTLCWEYIVQNKRPPPKDLELSDGTPLGERWKRIRGGRYQFTELQKKRVEDMVRLIQSTRDETREDENDRLLAEIRGYIAQNQKPPPKNLELQDGTKLWKKWNDMRTGVTQLSDLQKESVREMIGIIESREHDEKEKIVKLLLAYMTEHKKTPPKSFCMSDGTPLGRKWGKIKEGRYILREEQRKRIEDILPGAFEKVRSLETAYSISKEEKVSRLIAYYKLYNRWPPEDCVENGWRIGGFWSSVKYGYTSINNEQRTAIIALDSEAFSVKRRVDGVNDNVGKRQRQ